MGALIASLPFGHYASLLSTVGSNLGVHREVSLNLHHILLSPHRYVKILTAY